jgi:hypothetical protein
MNEDKFDYQFIAYSGAMHAFSNPNADKAHVAGLAYTMPKRQPGPGIR